ncbi:MAG: ABC transporter substrate-binding protein [Acidimicrobiia bacterium]
MSLETNRIFAARRALIGPLLALAVVIGACDVGMAESTTTTAAPTTTTTTAPTTTTTEPPPPPFSYRIGLAEAPTTDNYWAYYDPQSSLVDQYILDPTKPSLYTYDHPGLDLAADIAVDASPARPVEDADEWTVTVTIDPEARWSDGVPITAEDVVFTFDTVQEFGLRRGWATAYPAAGAETLGLVTVEAPTPETVVFRFNGRPGLPFWPNGPGTAPIMPRHFWQPIVEEARESADPITALLTASASSEPSGGPFVIRSFGRDRVEASPNPNYQRSGEEVTSGGATYQIGPFFDDLVFQVYAGTSAAAEALDAREIDVILSPVGLDPTTTAFLAANPDVETATNDTNGFRYLAFNLRNQPMANPAFRDALALMIDKEFLAQQVVAGQASPRYATVPPSNPRWFDPDAADGFAARYLDFTTEERLTAAVDTLEAAGFSWEQRPAWIDNAVVAGTGLTFEEAEVAPIRILGPGPSFDPIRSTYTLWIDQWARQLGFATEVTLTDFSSLVSRAFTPTPAGTLDYDLYVLGWRLPNPAMPVYHESFWASKNDTLLNDGNNNTGFSDPEFDALVVEYNRAETEEDAFELLWRMEQIVFDAKPYVVLYDAPVTEAFRRDTVVYPFSTSLSGLQFLNGLPALVRSAP